MKSWEIFNGEKVPIMEQVVGINGVVWALQRFDDGYSIYTNYKAPNGIHWCMFFGTDPGVTYRFYNDEEGSHLGRVTENGYVNVPLPNNEPFSACFSDLVDLPKPPADQPGL